MKPHLILDEQSVAESRGVTFHLNPATKHRDNPVLLPGEPHEWDSLQVHWPGTVLYSPLDQRFRCWYSGLDVVQSPNRHWLPGYAVSDDGVHWTKPKLDQVILNGQRTNQLRPHWTDWPTNIPKPPWGAYLLSHVFENPLPDAPPEKRFGSLWWEATQPGATGESIVRHRRKTLAFSPDGIHWNYECTPYEPGRDADKVFQDVSQLLYDPEERDPVFRVKGYSQVSRVRRWDGRPEVRHIGLVLGRDFNSLANPPEPVVLAPQEGIDEELHFASVKKIGGSYLLLFESDRCSQNPVHGDLRLAVSDDGLRFRRIHPRTPLVATGPKGSWDERVLVTTTCAMQEVGDEVCIFYFGCPSIFNSWPVNYAVSCERCGSLFSPNYLGLATLPRDRFAYATGDGTLTTHSLETGNDGLWLNAEGDRLGVAALDGSGKPKARGHLGDERRYTVYRKVVWNDSEPGGIGRLEITLTDGDKLFSVMY